MVKLPVNASNQASKEDVLISAVTFQRHLEQVAQKAFENGEPSCPIDYPSRSENQRR